MGAAPGATTLESNANHPNSIKGVAADANSSTDPSAPLEHRLQLSYTLHENLVTLSAASSAADAASADAGARGTKLTLTCSSTQQLTSTETLVRTIASSNAALPILFAASSRPVPSPAPAEATAAPPAAGAKPAKPGKPPPAPEEIPWQPDQLCTLPVDLGAILVGDTELVCMWPHKGLALPPQLQAYGRIQLRIQVLQCTIIHFCSWIARCSEAHTHTRYILATVQHSRCLKYVPY